jgi:hypothetical protein
MASKYVDTATRSCSESQPRPSAKNCAHQHVEGNAGHFRGHGDLRSIVRSTGTERLPAHHEFLGRPHFCCVEAADRRPDWPKERGVATCPSDNSRHYRAGPGESQQVRSARPHARGSGEVSTTGCSKCALDQHSIGFFFTTRRRLMESNGVGHGSRRGGRNKGPRNKGPGSRPGGRANSVTASIRRLLDPL